MICLPMLLVTAEDMYQERQIKGSLRTCINEPGLSSRCLNEVAVDRGA